MCIHDIAKDCFFLPKIGMIKHRFWDTQFYMLYKLAVCIDYIFTHPSCAQKENNHQRELNSLLKFSLLEV